MDNSGQTRNADGTTTIRFAPSHEQLRMIANDFEYPANEIIRVSPNADIKEDYELRLIELGINQLRIIADELERRPEPEVFANRIYMQLCRHFNRRDPYVDVPAFICKEIMDILTDQYAHLDNEQRESIWMMVAKVMAAGDGGDNTMTVFDAREYMRGQQWNLATALEWTQLEDFRSRLDFDPDTGKAWIDA